MKISHWNLIGFQLKTWNKQKNHDFIYLISHMNSHLISFLLYGNIHFIIVQRETCFLFFVDSLYFCYFWMLLTNFIQFFHSLHKIETLTFVEFLFIFSISNQIQLQTYIYFSLHSHIHNDILSNSEIWTDFVNSAIFAFVFFAQ